MENQDPSNQDAAPLEPVRPDYVLRLYVSGTTARSVQAIAAMRKVCESYLQGRYELDVIDIYQNPESTRDNNVVAVPTLVRLLPEPLRRLIGDLSNQERVLAGLDIVPMPEPGG